MRVAAVGLAVGADPAGVARGDADVLVLPECAAGGYARERRDTTAAAQRVGPGVVVGHFDGAGSAAGVWSDSGAWVTYRKRFPAPGEARVWAAGRDSPVATVGGRRVGMLVCADVLQRAAWAALFGRVDLVVVCAAWPHYAGRRAPPGLGWVYAGSTVYRNALIGQAAAWLGVPVVLANASSPAFDGLCHAWNARGVPIAEGPRVSVEVAPGVPGPRLGHTGRWRLFAPLYRGVSAIVGR